MSKQQNITFMKSYSLRYYVGQKLVETVMQNKPFALCKWKMNQIQSTTHRTGVLRIENV